MAQTRFQERHLSTLETKAAPYVIKMCTANKPNMNPSLLHPHKPPLVKAVRVAQKPTALAEARQQGAGQPLLAGNNHSYTADNQMRLT